MYLLHKDYISNNPGKCSSSPTIYKRMHSEVNMLEALDLSSSLDKLAKSQVGTLY